MNSRWSNGIYRRVLIVDGRRGVVTEQLLYGPNGRLLANSSSTDFRYIKEAQCSLPHDVQLRLTPAGGEPLALRIEVGSYAVNQLLSDDPRLFAMPQDGSERAIDLTRIAPPPAQATVAPPTIVQPPRGYSPPVGYVPEVAERPVYRGVYR